MTNTANFKNCVGTVTGVGTNGGPSAYGTYDQSGNVWEWNDLNNTSGSSRGLRGGAWNSLEASSMSSSGSSTSTPLGENFNIGFRISSRFSTLNPLGLDYFVTVGDSGNSNDFANIIGYGSVNYNYAIAQYQVTNCEYVEFLNAVASTDAYGLWDIEMANDPKGGITRSGSSGSFTYSAKTNMGNKPVNYVTWFDCARYCNWLHNGKPSGSQNNSATETGAYTLNGATSGNAAPSNSDAKYHLPTENEWYKAAYYKGGGTDAGYWNYATQTNNTIECVSTANSLGDGPFASNYVCPGVTTPTNCMCVSNTKEFDDQLRFKRPVFKQNGEIFIPGDNLGGTSVLDADFNLLKSVNVFVEYKDGPLLFSVKCRTDSYLSLEDETYMYLFVDVFSIGEGPSAQGKIRKVLKIDLSKFNNLIITYKLEGWINTPIESVEYRESVIVAPSTGSLVTNAVQEIYSVPEDKIISVGWIEEDYQFIISNSDVETSIVVANKLNDDGSITEITNYTDPENRKVNSIVDIFVDSNICYLLLRFWGGFATSITGHSLVKIDLINNISQYINITMPQQQHAGSDVTMEISDDKSFIILSSESSFQKINTNGLNLEYTISNFNWCSNQFCRTFSQISKDNSTIYVTNYRNIEKFNSSDGSKICELLVEDSNSTGTYIERIYQLSLSDEEDKIILTTKEQVFNSNTYWVKLIKILPKLILCLPPTPTTTSCDSFSVIIPNCDTAASTCHYLAEIYPNGCPKEYSCGCLINNICGPCNKGNNSANCENKAIWDDVDKILLPGNNVLGNVTTVGTNGGPSAYGTYDMGGNVTEWTDSIDSISAFPENGAIYRVHRGGSCTYFNSNLGSSIRVEVDPASIEGDRGFRVCSLLNENNFSNFVYVSDTGNNNDSNMDIYGISNAYGSVDHPYYIGKYTVTNCEYVEFLNSVASNEDTYELYDPGMEKIRGGIIKEEKLSEEGPDQTIIYEYKIKPNYENKPVNYISWFRAARYCNWLHNNKPVGNQDNATTEDGAYTLEGKMSGVDIVKNENAKYYIPSENEWYKAAYYKGSNSNDYWKYATQSDVAPTPVTANSVGDGILDNQPANVKEYVCENSFETQTPSPTQIELPCDTICIPDFQFDETTHELLKIFSTFNECENNACNCEIQLCGGAIDAFMSDGGVIIDIKVNTNPNCCCDIEYSLDNNESFSKLDNSIVDCGPSYYYNLSEIVCFGDLIP
jgi:formylglycine-generating enzyme required for sulfatase activity